MHLGRYPRSVTIVKRGMEGCTAHGLSGTRLRLRRAMWGQVKQAGVLLCAIAA